MNAFKLFLLAALLMYCKTSTACDCANRGSFLEVAPNSNFVALIKVTKYLTFRTKGESKAPISMEVEVIEVYKGQEKRKTLIVWGDNGFLCRIPIARFEPGNYYVMGLHFGIEAEAHSLETNRHYAITSCGEYWLSVDIAKGTASYKSKKGEYIIYLAAIKSAFFKD